MSKYIGTPVVSLSTDTVDVTGDITTTDATPEVIIVNDTHEDTDGGREGKVTFKGQASGGEETTLAQIQASHDGTSDDEKGDLIFKTNDGSDGTSPTTAMVIDSAQNVGIGTSSPSALLNLSLNESAAYSSTGEPREDVIIHNINGADGSGVNNHATLGFHVANGATSQGFLNYIRTADNTGAFTFSQRTGGSSYAEAMRILSDGVALVGRTAEGDSNAGVTLRPDGFTQFTRSGNLCSSMNRLSDNGGILRFQKGGTVVGSIGVDGNTKLIVDSQGGNLLMSVNGNAMASFDTDRLYPMVDDSYDLGLGSYRYDDIFATNGTIQTSDEREKQQIASLTDAEISAAKAISKLFKTFKWNSSVEENGDGARIHAGVIAQQVEQAMTDAGLTASNYAFWCSDTWWEKDVEVAAVEADDTVDPSIEAKDAYTRTDTYDTKDEAPEGATERNRKGIRYPELLSFIGAATEQRLTSIESRLTALEGE